MLTAIPKSLHFFPLAPVAMTARFEDTVLYRTLPVNGKDYKALMLGQSIESKNPQASKSVRDHVLLGSKANFKSQFISTTRALDIAVKYAAPVHTIVRINLAKYRESGGKVYDLSTEQCFEQYVPPIAGDISDAKAIWKRMDMDFGAGNHDLYRQEMYTEAALTNWECCCLFSVRSLEVLLDGEIPFNCVTVVEYATHVESVVNLPHQPHKIPFESFSKSVAANQTCYADGDNGGLINITLLTDSENQYLLKQAKRNSLEKVVVSSRELRSSIDLEFAAFDTYRRVAHYVPGVDIAVRDCVKITFRCKLSAAFQSASCDEDLVLNCLLFRCVKQPTSLLPVQKLTVQVPEIHQLSKQEYGEDYEIPNKPQTTMLEMMRKAAKEAGDEFTPEMEIYFKQFGDTRYYIRHHFDAADCTQLFKGMAADLLIGNAYAGGGYEKACIARSRTGNLYRLSADKALGNQIAESLNADRRDDHAGALLLESVSVAAKWEHIPMHTLCCQLQAKFHAIKAAVEANPDVFYSDAYRKLDLPYDVKRSIALYPSLNREAVEYDELFKRTSLSLIWKNYLLDRSNYLCSAIDMLVMKSKNADVEGNANVLEALFNMFNFMTGYRPFHRNMPR